MIQFWNPNALSYIIDWSAWATLIVGIAAVDGAVRVGRLQAGIARDQVAVADRQAKIMGHQVEIERTRLQAELYDERIKIYGAIEQYIVQGGDYGSQIPNDVRDNFFEAMSVSRFKLGDDVGELARSVYGAVTRIRMDVGRMDRLAADKEGLREGLMNRIDETNDELALFHERLQQTKERYLRLTVAPELPVVADQPE